MHYRAVGIPKPHELAASGRGEQGGAELFQPLAYRPRVESFHLDAKACDGGLLTVLVGAVRQYQARLRGREVEEIFPVLASLSGAIQHFIVASGLLKIRHPQMHAVQAEWAYQALLP